MKRADLVERLNRAFAASVWDMKLMEEAAEEIRQLRQIIAEIRAATEKANAI